MSEFIEIPNGLPESWPTAWSGNTIIDCGEQGRFCLEIGTEGHPSRIHIENYSEILRRWPQLWPQVHAVLSGMLTEWDLNYPISNPEMSLDMRLPAEPITEGVAWGVGARFSSGKGQWEVALNGWTVVPEDSQPYF